MSRTAEDLRHALTGGLAEAITEKGYAASTIADIVTHARVSKRTFYEHFTDKESCLVALYEHSCETLIAAVVAAAEGRPLGPAVRAGVRAYLAALESVPALSRTLLVEVQAAGPSAFRMRRRMQRRFADTVADLVAQDGGLRPLDPDLALALVGGINELVLHASDPYTGGGKPFTSLAGTVERLVHAVLSAPSDGMSATGDELSTG